jgi:anti-sigma regulatory factor (Ser/Thr protein kinase)
MRVMTPAAGQPPARASGPADAPARDYRDSPGSHASADLRAEPAAARRARRLTRDTLARWHLNHLTDDAQTIASELISNALDVATRPRGTLPAIIFAIHRRPDQLRITVWDNGPGQPRPAQPSPTPKPAGDSPSSTPSPTATGDGGPPPSAAGKSSMPPSPPPPPATPATVRRTTHAEPRPQARASHRRPGTHPRACRRPVPRDTSHHKTPRTEMSESGGLAGRAEARKAEQCMN